MSWLIITSFTKYNIFQLLDIHHYGFSVKSENWQVSEVTFSSERYSRDGLTRVKVLSLAK